VRSAPATLVAFLLLLMLAATTPTGTGSGVHASLLLHPIFSHLHLIDGRIVPHEQVAAPVNQLPLTTSGPAIGGGAGASAIADGLALSPALPWQEPVILAHPRDGYAPLEVIMPRGTTTPPPHPPPIVAA
jgi:hypothetical protein